MDKNQLSPIIFIDDSGDAGLKQNSSRYLLMTALVFQDNASATTTAITIRNFKKSISYHTELKFNTTKKSIVTEALNATSNCQLEIFTVYLDKKQLTKPIKSFYLYADLIRRLILDINPHFARIRIDGRSNKPYAKKLITYLRQSLNSKSCCRIKNIRLEDSSKIELIQLTDLVAGSIHRSLQSDKTDTNTYVEILKKFHPISIKQTNL